MLVVVAADEVAVLDVGIVIIAVLIVGAVDIALILITI